MFQNGSGKLPSTSYKSVPEIVIRLYTISHDFLKKGQTEDTSPGQMLQEHIMAVSFYLVEFISYKF